MLAWIRRRTKDQPDGPELPPGAPAEGEAPEPGESVGIPKQTAAAEAADSETGEGAARP
ncbi:hypothetical protein RM780_01370 [Streptomyces sp. DSM 44917]|uniref:Signal recognition particle-docking protein FtsY n=1 Tax=Streptomyces boetiae TaxID=3075541 RepID=A0ABU2L229_9ACTN|nr:hypothetical protein [Streptomyces sp. DSM 44917]MDT0305614.1 hypothetical protein [Streptomyces sp. DSM 44917]